VGGSCLSERLGHYIALTGAERSALSALEDQPRAVRRGTVIVEEGERSNELFIVQKGWLQSSVLLGNGGRQIMRIHLPGDVLGLPALAFDEAPETIAALSDTILCPFGRERLAGLFGAHPRLAARVAALLCDIFARLRLAGGAEGEMVHVPLTQEEIGDATGLTAVHVNRMIRFLVEEAIIERSGNAMRLLDGPRLAEEANFMSRLEIGTAWLPPAR
jgi:CRP-like cAMP-binding protein